MTSYGIYHQLGANKEIQALAAQHQELKSHSIEELAQMVSDKKINVNQLLHELRLRQEANPEDSGAWMKLGELLTLSAAGSTSSQEPQAETDSMRQLAKQAFNRASQIGNKEQQINTRIEVAKTYLIYREFDSALEQLNLVLLKNNTHEGALMMKGLTQSRLEKHQAAIDTWKFLASRRQQNSESAQLINNLIEKELERLKFTESQFIQITINNFANLDLQSFTKAFAIVRPVAGGAPIAVKSIDISQLEQTIKVTPENLMFSTADFWQAIDLKVEIRLSKTGLAKPEAGDLFGQISPIQGLTPTQNYSLTIDQVVN